ncbi:DUF2591 family protein [Xenorhabdus sp. ZM]|uniref:phage protein NinX family protein n=1 Tax=Xenorhabdus szentirmaii TaxID=290112 RepID=UPI0019BF6194|nr:phage protein NinX family protein [Xenorhabdus sp. ZM]MBD2804100.1 DUF2591 family protein [Xenorhabdus sp. ZM]
MKLKTSELTGRALDYAVAICEGWDLDSLIENLENIPEYSTEWSECGPLITEYSTELTHWNELEWSSRMAGCTSEPSGETPQIAICRAIAVAYLDEEVDIPDELLEPEGK